MTLHVEGLWRYAVKTLAGERLSDRSDRTWTGFTGDRLVRVRGPEGVRTARRHYRLLGLRGTLGSGWSPAHQWPSVWTASDALALVKVAGGDDAWLEEAHPTERFDVLPLLVATDGAVAAFGRDVRRLRGRISSLAA